MKPLQQTTYRAAWGGSSVLLKTGLVAVALLMLLALAIGGKSWWQNRAYEKREAARMAEREQLQQEKAQLQAEKQKALTDAAEAEAQRDIYKQVAESKRTDRAQTVKELEQIEQEHSQHKAEVEAAGGAMSDSELRDELCKRLAARGYPPCPK